MREIAGSRKTSMGFLPFPILKAKIISSTGQNIPFQHMGVYINVFWFFFRSGFTHLSPIFWKRFQIYIYTVKFTNIPCKFLGLDWGVLLQNLSLPLSDDLFIAMFNVFLLMNNLLKLSLFLGKITHPLWSSMLVIRNNCNLKCKTSVCN